MPATETTHCFYKNGLRFRCRKCHHCCSGESGTIYTSRAELERIAQFLKKPLGEVKKKYTYPFRNHVSIREEKNGDCVFLTKNGCRIYKYRPKQCRTYPFWRSILRSEKSFEEEKKECPGLGKGKLYSKEEIDARQK